nr:Putative reactive intermediate deaminase TdcF [Paraburkholderia busanensis]
MNPSRIPLHVAVCAAVALSACAPLEPHKEVISTKNAPSAIGPYSQAIRSGSTVFLSGQLPIDPTTNAPAITASIEDQTKLVLDNLRAVLAAKGMTLDDIVSTQVYMTDLNEFPRMNAVYATYFRDQPPARATVGVSRLARDLKIEISAVAVKR